MEQYSDFANQNGIAIPIIQRDYVQGANVNFEKRDNFLSSLLDALLHDTPYEMDFIYGSSDGDFFTPVDGQQRLTTLALLGWILNQKTSGKYNKQFKELTYTTRPSTEQFCKELFAYQLPDDYDAISIHIKSVPGWFTNRWLFDPSVNAMLDFLDKADEMLKQQHYAEHISEMADRFFKASPIQFERLDMNALYLNDDLYIKMNARGKLLTPFENWKAEFEGHLEDSFPGVDYDKAIPGATKSTLLEYFEYVIEHDWCDLLWPIAYDRWNKLSSKERREVLYPRIDEFFMNLFDYISRFILFASLKDAESELKGKPYKEVRMLYDYEKDKSRIDIYNNVDNVRKLFRILDLLVELKACNNTFEDFFGQYFICTKSRARLNTADKFKVNLYDKSVDLFTLCIGNELDTATEVMLWAVLEWLLQHPDCICVTSADTDMTDFLRIMMGWTRGKRQRLKNGLSVSTNLRLDDYYEANQIIVTLAKAQNGVDLFKALAETTQKSLSAEREKGRYYNTPKFDIVRELSTCVELYYCFNLLWPSLDIVEDINKYVKRFYVFMAMKDTKRIRELNSHGFFGVCPMNYYYFYGEKDRWDYIFTTGSSDKNYQNTVDAFTAWMNNKKPKSPFKPNQMAYYIDKYPDFIEARYNHQYSGYPCHYFTYGQNCEFEIWAVKTFSTNPILGYNVDPYGYVVEKLYNGPYKLQAISENSQHGFLWIDGGMYMECLENGWQIGLTDRRFNASKKFLHRFKENEDGFVDPQGVFELEGTILLDLKNKDRIQTALEFLDAIKE